MQMASSCRCRHGQDADQVVPDGAATLWSPPVASPSTPLAPPATPPLPGPPPSHASPSPPLGAVGRVTTRRPNREPPRVPRRTAPHRPLCLSPPRKLRRPACPDATPSTRRPSLPSAQPPRATTPTRRPDPCLSTAEPRHPSISMTEETVVQLHPAATPTARRPSSPAAQQIGRAHV